MAMDYASAVAFLQKSSTGDGSSVYEHLAKVLSKVRDLLANRLLLRSKLSWNAPTGSGG